MISINANIFNAPESDVIGELELFLADLRAVLEAAKEVRESACDSLKPKLMIIQGVDKHRKSSSFQEAR